ncbi:MAG: ATP phosphoribosyltransferase regulatory subunit [Prochloraceae cyanobacterium]
MIYQPPAGARDLLPLEVAQKCWINDRIQSVFQQWGYHRIVTSTLEKLDTILAGGAIEHSTIIQLQDRSTETLGLRPELTASIARAAVTRMGDNTIPQRLCYRANVFRNPPQRSDRGRQLEFYQAGVELLFAGGLLADAEIILLLADCLDLLGVEKWHLIMGEAELTRSLLSPIPASLQKQVRNCIANLDRVSIENLDISETMRDRALLLFDLRGNPTEVLQKVSTIDLDDSAKEIVNNLKSLIELLESSSSKPLPLILDLSLVKDFNYYTGIVFEAVSYQDTRWDILARGGRYDRLLGVYHPQGKSFPGIGFCLQIEDLHACLLSSSKLPQQTTPSDWLVVPETKEAIAAAFIYAQKLRRKSPEMLRVEIETGDRTPEEVRDYARKSRITNLAWIRADTVVNTETL